VITTRGNAYAHVVLRGGSDGPNFDSVHVALVEKDLEKAGLPHNIMIDCSHANSNKNPELQPLVLENVGHQIADGNRSIKGLMIESHIHSGNQNLTDDKTQLSYGVSITDGCINWETTESALLKFRDTVKAALQAR
jgi:3-deoxy-7-phosphoheptulonate synthase